jgi:phosphoribosylanthranilate isomerase
MWVKVCGLRHRRDVESAIEAGADAVGFVVAESPRQVSIARVRKLRDGVPVRTVLVTVDARPEALMRWVEQSGVDSVQPHGRHATEAGNRAIAAGLMVLHPVSVVGKVDLSRIGDERIPLLDTHVPDVRGGSGISFDWSLVHDVDRDFILAGGLTPANVGGAVAAVRPWGVDASSGLESAPGVKDPERITAFVREAKRA